MPPIEPVLVLAAMVFAVSVLVLAALAFVSSGFGAWFALVCIVLALVLDWPLP